MPAMDEAVTDGHDVPPFALAYSLRQTMAGMPQQQLIWLDVTVRDILARYDVGETVGVGGFAVVKKGRDKRTGEIVAIKVQSSFCIMLTVRALIFQYDGFRPQIWGGSEPLQVVDKWRYATEESSEREIRVLSKVGHMNCIKMHAVFVTARRVYIVTELVTGGELLDIVTEHGVFSEPQAAYLVKQVLSGVAYLHSKGIVHRDLKLENLLLHGELPKAVVKIADFGLSKVFSSNATLSTVCGSPLYMAPELLMLDQKSAYSPAVDIWSVGVILFILLAGYSPFDDVNDAALFEKIKSGKYDDGDPVWDTISTGAKALVAQMLVVHAENRISAEQCLQNDWLVQQSGIVENLEDGAVLPKAPQAACVRTERQIRAVSQMRTTRSMQQQVCAAANAGHAEVPAMVEDLLITTKNSFTEGQGSAVEAGQSEDARSKEAEGGGHDQSHGDLDENDDMASYL